MTRSRRTKRSLISDRLLRVFGFLALTVAILSVPVAPNDDPLAFVGSRSLMDVFASMFGITDDAWGDHDTIYLMRRSDLALGFFDAMSWLCRPLRATWEFGSHDLAYAYPLLIGVPLFVPLKVSLRPLSVSSVWTCAAFAYPMLIVAFSLELIAVRDTSAYHEFAADLFLGLQLSPLGLFWMAMPTLALWRSSWVRSRPDPISPPAP
jgi:hypothetical protein